MSTTRRRPNQSRHNPQTADSNTACIRGIRLSFRQTRFCHTRRFLRQGVKCFVRSSYPTSAFIMSYICFGVRLCVKYKV